MCPEAVAAPHKQRKRRHARDKLWIKEEKKTQRGEVKKGWMGDEEE